VVEAALVVEAHQVTLLVLMAVLVAEVAEAMVEDLAVMELQVKATTAVQLLVVVVVQVALETVLMV
jgi:hypothetical protein